MWRLERILPPLVLVVAIVWLISGTKITPVPEPVSGRRITGIASGIISPNELSAMMDSPMIGLYDEHDSLIYAGTPMQMETYLRAMADSLDSTLTPERLFPSGP